MLFTAVGGKLAQESVIALGLAMIVILDWFIDRVETAQNVWSDCVACKVFDELGYGDEIMKKAQQGVSGGEALELVNQPGGGSPDEPKDKKRFLEGMDTNDE